MTQHWQIRISGQPKKRPNIELLVQAVLALAEQLREQATDHEVAQVDQKPDVPGEAP